LNCRKNFSVDLFGYIKKNLSPLHCKKEKAITMQRKQLHNDIAKRFSHDGNETFAGRLYCNIKC